MPLCYSSIFSSYATATLLHSCNTPSVVQSGQPLEGGGHPGGNLNLAPLFDLGHVQVLFCQQGGTLKHKL